MWSRVAHHWFTPVEGVVHCADDPRLQWFSQPEVVRIVRRLFELRDHWNVDDSFMVWTLGKPIYLGSEGVVDAKTTELLESQFSWVYARLRDRLTTLVGQRFEYDDVRANRPGFHIFPFRRLISAHLPWGSVHVDRQYEQVRVDPANYVIDTEYTLSFTVPLQFGGDGSCAGISIIDGQGRRVLVDYALGCAAIHTGNETHQILPASTGRGAFADAILDRISIQGHAVAVRHRQTRKFSHFLIYW